MMEQKELHATLPFMRRALDLLPDGVLIIGADREVLYLNDAFKHLWQIPAEVVVRGDRAMLDHVLGQLEDPAAFLSAVERLYQSPESSEDEIAFNDGRVFKRRSVALEGGAAAGFSRIWIFSDFTEAWSARIDALTGLLNRRAYSNELPAFMATDHPDQTKAFALIDVDQFKAFNDRYGHADGDAVLERVGLILEKGADLRSRKAFRIGGDEFAIASVHEDDKAALRYHQQIVGSIQQAGIPHVGNRPHGVVTVSMGLGFFSGPDDPGDVFAKVDKALYRAKKLGSNRIVIAPIDQTLERTESLVGVRNSVGSDLHIHSEPISLPVPSLTSKSGADKAVAQPSIIYDIVAIQKRERAQAEILQMVAGGEPVQQILDALCCLGEAQLPGSRCSVLMVSQDGNRFDGGAAPFLPKELQELVAGINIGPGVGSCGTAAFEKRDVVSANISDDPLWDAWRVTFEPLGVKACWSRPVFGTDGRVLATYGFYFSEVRSPSAEELESLENLCQLAAVAISKARTHEALKESEEHHRFTVEFNPQIPWTSDSQGRILSVSSRWAEATGIPVEDALGTGWFRALHPEDTHRVVAYWSEHLETGQPVDLKYRIRLKEGPYRWVRARASARRADNGAIIKWYGAVEDIHDAEQATERLRRQAYQDEITRLPNRRAFEERLARRLAMDDAVAQVVMLDINGFRLVNERFGHEAGDAALRLFGRYLRNAIPQADIVARIVGDAFVVLLANDSAEETLQRFARRIGQSLDNQLGKNTKTRLCGVSIGCVEVRQGDAVDEVVRRARLALDAAKKNPNQSFMLFTPALPKVSEERFDQIELARTALKSGWIMPVYQPMMDLRSGEVAGAEALLRVDHPHLGLQGPNLIWAALDAPKIGKVIDDKMIALVLSDLSHWTPWPKELGSVSINLSTEILTQPGIARSLLRKLERKGISTRQVTVEITERVLVDQLSSKSHQALLDLQRHGIRVSLDDFGTGFASLTHLQQLPVDEIKIDQTFVRDLKREGPNAAIVKSMIGLGCNMGIDVVAEGVETAEQAELLREWGCRYAQGYFFHRPMPANDFATLCGWSDDQGLSGTRGRQKEVWHSSRPDDARRTNEWRSASQAC